MFLESGIFLAALGITTLEMVEASAVGLALYSESRKLEAFFFVSLGAMVVFAPMFALGKVISFLPLYLVRLLGGSLLLYFGLRLVKSARRSVLKERKNAQFSEHFEKGLALTAFSVGAVEAFEAAIVLVALLPNSFDSTTLGMGVGILTVVIATYALRTHVRKLKQAIIKVVVSSLLLSFAVLWFSEVFVNLTDIVLVPLFTGFFAVVYSIANRQSPQTITAETHKFDASSNFHN